MARTEARVVCSTGGAMLIPSTRAGSSICSRLRPGLAPRVTYPRPLGSQFSLSASHVETAVASRNDGRERATSVVGAGVGPHVGEPLAGVEIPVRGSRENNRPSERPDGTTGGCGAPYEAPAGELGAPVRFPAPVPYGGVMWSPATPRNST